ncbi:uncharacterized protein TNCT_9961 [Trichonephila clavata]|uniref:Uncharacterized protein n=1 Tax=Trichonephila clavata TaxID=2740835 RepID=A0A8X6I3M7_TRICU|nr:uncharacterized protein TNCT_9961 [Trichonephila clavata]
MECSKVCRALRISGKLGGCNCNYVMFTKRSSEISRSFETEVRDLEQLRQDLTGDAYGDENSEYEELDEKENDRPQSPRNLVDLIRRQVMKPILRDRNY